MRKKGFTLLELIIVIIIVGVLASLALPRFMKMINSSQAVEAMNYFTEIHREIQRCILFGGADTNTIAGPCSTTTYNKYSAEISANLGAHFDLTSNDLTDMFSPNYCYTMRFLHRANTGGIYGQYCNADLPGGWISFDAVGAAYNQGVTFVGFGDLRGVKIIP